MAWEHPALSDDVTYSTENTRPGCARAGCALRAERVRVRARALRDGLPLEGGVTSASVFTKRKRKKIKMSGIEFSATRATCCEIEGNADIACEGTRARAPRSRVCSCKWVGHTETKQN